MSDSQKLTKKQRKSLAFRDKVNKKKSKSKPDPLDVPVSDDIEQNEEAVEETKQTEKVLGKRKRVETSANNDESTTHKSAKKSKFREKAKDAISKEKHDVVSKEGDENNPLASSSKASNPQKPRYILFIGAHPSSF